MAAFVVVGGKGIIVNRMRGTGTEPLNLQWGTSGTTATAADTGLGSTATTTEARTAGTTSSQTTTNTGDTWRVVGTITAAGARTIQEVGLYDTAGSGSPPTGGTFFLHADHGSTVFATNDSISYTINVQFT